jgi:glycosyltransferase involved in cell wall biosynthesis
MRTEGHPGVGRKKGTIAVDARMIEASGIGTCIAQWLPRLIAARSDLDFVLLGPASTLRELPWTHGSNVRVIGLDAPIYSLREQISLLHCTPRGTDVFWSPHYNIPLAWRGRLVVTIHDLAHLALPEMVDGAHRRAYARFMFHRVSRSAEAIATDSDFTRTEFERLVGVRRAKPEVVHPGVDRSWFEVSASPAPHPGRYLLYVGNVKPHKNLGRLVEAFAQLRSGVECDLLIVGKNEGFLSPDTGLRGAAAALGPRVQLLGEVSQGLLKRYVAHAQALVLPSLYEGFGLPPLEAMACGCPAIVSQTASLPEICGDAALYCDPLDPASIAGAMLRVLTQPDLRDTLRCRGLQRARRFTWEGSAQTLLNIFDRVLAA